MKIHSVPFLESSSLKMRFFDQKRKNIRPKTETQKKRSLETQGIYVLVCGAQQWSMDLASGVFLVFGMYLSGV